MQPDAPDLLHVAEYNGKEDQHTYRDTGDIAGGQTSIKIETEDSETSDNGADDGRPTVGGMFV